MAEVVGAIASAVTLASLFKACLDAFDLFQAAQKTECDLQRLFVRLNIERLRLYTWGEAMGLTEPPRSRKKTVLETASCRGLVKDTLEAMKQLFQDSEKIQTRYGCKQATLVPRSVGLGDTSIMDDLAASFSNFWVPAALSSPPKPLRNKTLTKVRWAIHDRKKFDVLIRELKELVDGLQSITESIFAASRQGGMLRFGIQQIKNLDTLEVVSAACEVDYPDISEAATVKLDVMTVGTSQRQDILDWLDETKDDLPDPSLPKPFMQGNRASGLSNLNSIVAEYLQNKGYTDTRAVFVAETWTAEESRPVQPAAEDSVPKQKMGAEPEQNQTTQTSKRFRKRRRIS
ncbi:uncharacterized protein BDR25DRAFT_306531 [Lindgomyces ingoldianus]|uniref:Uncharacterized protein n=1 Tax=Lindgomyces ingoldianus TaxID=673940 RepID=A0ACB6QFU9_9PLEO|nr:uncharacterized protein BDR25DRAFT_306531 [Lindgomyces ingoldianus]KAF2465750.1 hypothetical protein BDR25DRAFT_306531 [Lindgomyces ingoldianus]